MRCGVLALQGDWAAHTQRLRSLGVDTAPVRTPAELDQVGALVMQGGESTTMLRLLATDDLTTVLSERIRDGMPVLATCAGVILLAVATEPAQPTLRLLDIDVARNAYGRQVHSCVAGVELAAELGPPAHFEGVFIRAPKITRTGPGVEVLGWYDGDAALVRQGAIIAATFHPELTEDDRVHRLLVGGEARHDG